jgi:hypothetical protein
MTPQTRLGPGAGMTRRAALGVGVLVSVGGCALYNPVSE